MRAASAALFPAVALPAHYPAPDAAAGTVLAWSLFPPTDPAARTLSEASGLVITISYPTVTTDILSGQLSQPQLPKCLRGRKEPSRLSWAQPLTS